MYKFKCDFCYRIWTKICHLGYKILRFLYGYHKKIKLKINSDNLNPYRYISIYPTNMLIDVIDTLYEPTKSFPKYTTITPVLNEEKNIFDVLVSIENQTCLPDQVIIIDGYSEDTTVRIINDYKNSSKLNIEIISSKIRNIAHQRNLGIKHARNEIIINVDSGTYLDPNYAASMLGPFAENPKVDLVGGVHYPKMQYPWSMQFSPEVHFKHRLDPYGACVAYKKDIAMSIGCYPEYVTYAGEDTFFAYKYKKRSHHWVLNKAAFMLWDHPDTLEKFQIKICHYLVANFEIGLWPYFYNGARFHLPLWIGYFFKHFRKNYSTFLKRQSAIELDKRNIKGLKFILSPKRITDPENEALRELTIKLISDNYKVFFIDFADKPPKNSAPVFIDTDHSLLELIHHTKFRINSFKKRYGKFIENAEFISGKEV